MTQERIRTEIEVIAKSIAVMLAEREFPQGTVDLTPGVALKPEVQEVVEEHSDIIEQALWDLHGTIRATYEGKNV